MKRILLGVTGSSAAPRAVELAARLTKNGYAVDVILTEAGTRFASPEDFAAATGRAVYTDLFANGTQGEGLHAALARDADLAVIAPATAHTIARLAMGFADDLLTASLLALEETPVLLCPSMDPVTYRNPLTQENRRTLENLGFYFLGPRTTERGKGELAALDSIVEKTGEMLDPACWGAYI